MNYPLLAVSLAVLTATSAPKAAREAPLYPVFIGDARLRQVITVEQPHEKLGALLTRLHQVLGVDLVVQGDWLNREVSIHVKDRSGREILTHLGMLTQGTWVKRGSAYLLVSSEATVAIQPFAVRDMLVRQRELVRLLTKEQYSVLQVGGKLGYASLTDAQKRALSVILGVEYAMHPERHPQEIVGGEGVEIRLLTGNDPALMLMAPSFQPSGEKMTQQFADVPLNRP